MPKRFDYSNTPGARFEAVLLNFIRGIHGERDNPLTKKQILEHFPGTPEDATSRELFELVDKGYVSIKANTLGRRKPRVSYRYEITDKGRERFEWFVQNRYCHTGSKRGELS